MTFGVGSAVGHRAVDSMLGPRTVQHEFVGADGAAGAAAGGAPNMAPPTEMAPPSDMGSADSWSKPEWGQQPPPEWN